LAQNRWNFGSDSSSPLTLPPISAQSELLDRVVELLGGEVRVLQGHRRQADKTVRLCGADFGELLVLQLDDLPGEVGLGLVPEDRVEAQRLDVDALPIHRRDPFRRNDERWRRRLQPHQRVRLGHVAMGVQIDRPDALSADSDFPSPGLPLREGRARESTSQSRERGEPAADAD